MCARVCVKAHILNTKGVTMVSVEVKGRLARVCSLLPTMRALGIGIELRL